MQIKKFKVVGIAVRYFIYERKMSLILFVPHYYKNVNNKYQLLSEQIYC
jgi:hypothetical protein